MFPLEAFNRSLFLQLNAGPDTPAWQITMALFVAEYLIAAIPLLMLGIWCWTDRDRRSTALKACVVTLAALAGNQLIGMIWPHPRPFMIGLGHTWIRHVADPSFPSDHMTVFVGIGLTLALDRMSAWGMATLWASLAVAWSRVFLGVHFPLDMVGALGVAAAAYAVVTPLWRRLGDPLLRLAQRPYQGLLSGPIARGWVQP